MQMASVEAFYPSGDSGDTQGLVVIFFEAVEGKAFDRTVLEDHHS